MAQGKRCFSGRILSLFWVLPFNRLLHKREEEKRKKAWRENKLNGKIQDECQHHFQNGFGTTRPHPFSYAYNCVFVLSSPTC